MARIRTIKPEFFRHEELFELEQSTGQPLRLAFISLWTVADRAGRFKWRPRALKLDCLPYDDVDFSRVLDALESRGFVVRYDVEGEQFGWIPSFTKHQIVNNKEARSQLPEPSENNILHASGTRDDRVACANSTVLNREKGEREQEREQEGEGDLSIASQSHPEPKRVRGADIQTAKRFYEVYPKHVDPRDAEKKFISVVKSGVDPDRIIAAAERFAEAHRRAGTDKQMIPAPAVWLNRGGYDSEDLPMPSRAGPAPLRKNPDLEAYKKLVSEDRERNRQNGPTNSTARAALGIFDTPSRVAPLEDRDGSEGQVIDMLGRCAYG